MVNPVQQDQLDPLALGRLDRQDRLVLKDQPVNKVKSDLLVHVAQAIQERKVLLVVRARLDLLARKVPQEHKDQLVHRENLGSRVRLDLQGHVVQVQLGHKDQLELPVVVGVQMYYCLPHQGQRDSHSQME